MTEDFYLSGVQIDQIRTLGALRIQGIFIPTHTDALAHICRVKNTAEFRRNLAMVWLCVFGG